MNTLTFRNATEKDLPKIVAIYNATISSRMVTADTEPVSIQSKLPWFKAHNPKTRPLLMIEDENQNSIGWVSFQSFYGRPAYQATAEISIYLEENQRGKGVGKYVLAYWIENAPRIGIKTLLAFIFAHNEPSLHLFQNFGFKEWAHLPDIAEMDGKKYSLKILGRKIAE